jgi:hypothetical protein
MQIMQNQAVRKHYRWYFNDEKTPQEKHSRGVEVHVHRSGVFRLYICRAIMKDMSIGGAGLLVPTNQKIPDAISVAYDGKTHAKGQVVYRRAESEKLMFIGVEWVSADYQRTLALLRKLSKKAYRPAKNPLWEILNGK